MRAEEKKSVRIIISRTAGKRILEIKKAVDVPNFILRENAGQRKDIKNIVP